MSVIIQVICAVLAGSILAYLIANGRRTKTTYSYMNCISLLLMWNISEVLLILSENPVEEMLALKLKFLPVVYIGACWLHFCLLATNCEWAKKKIFEVVLFSIPAILYLFLITNELHHLFYTEVIFKTRLCRGPIFWVHTVESYFCLISGTLYLFINMRRKFGKRTRESIWLIMAVLLPMVANILMLAEVIPNQGTDITAQVMLSSIIFLGVAVYQKKFLNLIPVAARHFIENMSDGIIIIDHENLVVGMNEAVNSLLPHLRLNIFDQADKITAYIRENACAKADDALLEAFEKDKGVKLVKGFIKLDEMELSIEVRELTGFRQSAAGRVIVIEDRSEEQQLLREIQNKNLLLTNANENLRMSNKMLSEANNRLEQFSATVEELAVSRERNRMGREVHDTVGHTLTLLIALAENVKLRLGEDQQDIRDSLDMSIDLSRQALNDIRSCLKGICEESFKKIELAEWLNYLEKINASSGIKVAYTIPDELPVLDAPRVMAIYRICQESVTNAIRHGHAKVVNIIIKNQPNSLRLYIFDDGQGCPEIIKGYGLAGMEERVRKLGGNISFGSDGEQGFNIIAEIPLFL